MDQAGAMVRRAFVIGFDGVEAPKTAGQRNENIAAVAEIMA
jgi:hypothetical protein